MMKQKKLIIAIVLILVVILYIWLWLWNKLNKIENRIDYKDLFKYSLMVHLDDPISEKRLDKVKKIYNNYDLPINIMKATHWKYDANELSKYPIDKQDLIQYRPGAYGLAGSLYKCLKKAHDNNWPYLLFFEDDATPILPPNKFKKRWLEVLNTMPDNKEGIYLLGCGIYCRTNKNDELKWIRQSRIGNYSSGTHCVYFGKQSIEKLINYLKNNQIDEPIDEWLKKYDPWVWYGDLSDSGMFRGLYEQIGINCDNVNTLEGPINSDII